MFVEPKNIIMIFTDEIKKKIVQKVIEFSQDNTAGTVVNIHGIRTIVHELIPHLFFNTEYIDKYIDENESDNGYLVKASDFTAAVEVIFRGQ